MKPQFRLFWLREDGRDTGTLVEADTLDSTVRDRVLALSADSVTPLDLYLPFLDGREITRKYESLGHVQFRREGQVIRHIPATANAALRNHAAELLCLHPAWIQAPRARKPHAFSAWQQVALYLQSEFRKTLLARYTSNLDRLKDREESYPVLVFVASRLCFGRPRTEFTYDIAEPDVTTRALRMTGRAMRATLAAIEDRLRDSGRAGLARHYNPLWHEDIQREVLRNPQAFVNILGDEAQFVNAVVELGSSGSVQMIKPFARIALSALRNTHGLDLRDQAIPLINGATTVLEAFANRRRAAKSRTPTESPSTSQSALGPLYPPSLAPGTSGHYMPGSAASPS